MKQTKLIILSGLSGSGKSSALKYLEDAGFLCIDNLPGELLINFIDLFLNKKTTLPLKKMAIVMDARGDAFIKNFEDYFKILKRKKLKFLLLFFECKHKILIRRFSETKHRHPMSLEGSVRKGIEVEKSLLAPVRSFADRIIDTSELSIHELKSELFKATGKTAEAKPLTTNVMSFGFKYGIPAQADIVMDVRFLSNPYFVEKLRHKNGLNADVKKYIMKQKPSLKFLRDFSKLLSSLMNQYKKEGKSYLTVAIGCTGGVHRSVAISEGLCKALKKEGYYTKVEHRDIAN